MSARTVRTAMATLLAVAGLLPLAPGAVARAGIAPSGVADSATRPLASPAAGRQEAAISNSSVQQIANQERAALGRAGWGVALNTGVTTQDVQASGGAASAAPLAQVGRPRASAVAEGRANSQAAAPERWTLQGAGAGHGVGLSQYGALAQAQSGWSAEQTLRFYYPGVTLTPGADAMTLVVNLDADVSSSTVTTSALAAGGGAFTVSAAGTTLSGGAGNAVRFTRSGGSVSASCPSCTGATSVSGPQLTLRFADGKTMATVGGARYDVGVLTVVPSQDRGETIEVGLRVRLHDEYLDRIAEMPWSWPTAALQAQAVAARSYALSRVNDGLRSDCSCHVLDTSADQLFAGYPADGNLAGWPAWRAAVRAGGGESTGLLLRYAGTVIRAYYSPSNGGYTQSAADGLGMALPYLISTPDPWSRKAGNPYLFWSKTVSAADLAAATGSSQVARLNLLSRTESRSLRTVKAYTSAGAESRVGGNSFAAALGLPSPWVRHRGERISGPDQASLAVALARGIPAGARNVVLTSAEPAKLADSVAIPPLAKALGAPVLLTDPYALPMPTVGELNRRVTALKTAYVVGGVDTINERVVEQLKARGLKVVRIDGADRYEVAARIATRLHQLKPVTNAIVVGGAALPDAISAGGPAAATGSAILFTAPKGLSTPAAAFLDLAKPKTVQVTGGTTSVSAAVIDQIKARGLSTVRLSGADRYAVSVAVSSYFVPRIPGTRLVIAAGDNHLLQDGVLGAALARPTVLVSQDYLPATSAAYLQTLGWIGTITAIGGPSHLDEATWTKVLES